MTGEVVVLTKETPVCEWLLEVVETALAWLGMPMYERKL